MPWCIALVRCFNCWCFRDWCSECSCRFSKSVSNKLRRTSFLIPHPQCMQFLRQNGWTNSRLDGPCFLLTSTWLHGERKLCKLQSWQQQLCDGEHFRTSLVLWLLLCIFEVQHSDTFEPGHGPSVVCTHASCVVHFESVHSSVATSCTTLSIP